MRRSDNNGKIGRYPDNMMLGASVGIFAAYIMFGKREGVRLFRWNSLAVSVEQLGCFGGTALSGIAFPPEQHFPKRSALTCARRSWFYLLSG